MNYQAETVDLVQDKGSADAGGERTSDPDEP
jgi:hypothetical protein